ncbi:homing endonuclease associated repeat-containing protein [Halorubrum saccharovorum]|nr:hypothetical protein [Halorubrum saccharovorum]
MTRGEQHSDEELIEDIKRVSDLTGRTPPTKTKYTEYGILDWVSKNLG